MLLMNTTFASHIFHILYIETENIVHMKHDKREHFIQNVLTVLSIYQPLFYYCS